MICIAEILCFAQRAAANEELIEFCMQRWAPMFPNFWWDSIDSCCFATFQVPYGF